MEIPRRNKQGLRTSYELYITKGGIYCGRDINSKEWFAVNLHTRNKQIAINRLNDADVFWHEDSNSEMDRADLEKHMRT